MNIKQYYKAKGFTLVELAVTVAIIIILMAVSVPIYRSNLDNYRRTEGYALLASIRSAQERYYSEYGCFLPSSCGSGGGGNNANVWNVDYYTCNENVLGINARTNKYFTRFCIGGFYAGSNKSWQFAAYVQSSAVGYLTMIYNLTSGVVTRQ